MNKKLGLITKRILILALIVTLLILVLINVSTLLSINAIKQDRIVRVGYFSAIINSGSMEPAFSKNDLLILKGADGYQTNDVITYVSQRGSLITHRIMTVLEDGYITQGDANNIPDEKIYGQQVLGKVVYAIPGVGGVIAGITSPLGLVFLIGIFLLIWAIQRIMRNQNECRNEKEKKIIGDLPES